MYGCVYACTIIFDMYWIFLYYFATIFIDKEDLDIECVKNWILKNMMFITPLIFTNIPKMAIFYNHAPALSMSRARVRRASMHSSVRIDHSTSDRRHLSCSIGRLTDYAFLTSTYTINLYYTINVNDLSQTILLFFVILAQVLFHR